MQMPAFPKNPWGNINFIPIQCLLRCFLVFFYSELSVFSNSQNGQMSELYSAEWNGSAFLISGNGISNQEFPTFNLYENNFYVFDNNSSLQSRINLGENTNSIYLKSDVWNNGAYSDDEYLLFQPDFNSSRTFYYFKPGSNSSTGQINVSAYDSAFLHPQVNIPSFKFGQSVVINDWNQTIFGSPGSAGFDDGAIHIFNRESNGSYSYHEKIIPLVSGLLGQFGHSLDVANQFLFVGSPDISSYSGSVDIFKRESNGSYGFFQSLNSYSNALDSFGWDISVDGQDLAVSSLQSINNQSGKVSIFENNGTNWNFNSFLSADDNQSNDEFGYAINLVGSRLLVGAPKADANGTNSGAAYIFEKNASGWFQTEKLVPTGLSAGDEFGYSVTLSENMAFVGARQKDGDVNNTNAGAVYVFHFNGSSWNEVRKIYPPSFHDNQFFSSDLFFHEDILAVSSPMIGEGAAYLYRIEDNGSLVTFLSTLNLSEANATDQNQFSITLSDGVAIVGIPGDGTYENFGGGALAFFNDAWQKKILPNLAPIIDHNSSKNHIMAEDNGTYTYDFNGSHPFDSNLTWTLSQYPDFNATFSLNPSSGIFSYTPDGNYSGLHNFTAILSNGKSSDSIDFNVTVTPVQDPPVFYPSTTLISAMEGDEYNQTISVFDADDDNLTITYISPDLDLNISGFNLIGTPTIGRAQDSNFTDYNVTLSVSDGISAPLNQIFPLRIYKRNNPPQIWVDGNSSIRTIDLNLTEDFSPSDWHAVFPNLDYNDSDDDKLYLNLSVYPLGDLNITDMNTSIQYFPPFVVTDVNTSILYSPPFSHFNGTDSFTIILTDDGEGNKTATLTFNLIVSPVNDPPVITSAPPTTQIREGQLFNYPIVIVDPDKLDMNSTETLTVTIDNLPANGWLDYNTSTGVLSGTPSWSDYEENGPRLIVINVQDKAGLRDTQAFTLEVIPNNYPPVISEGSTFFTSVNEDSSISDWGNLNLVATEQDTTFGILSWKVESPPNGGNVTVSGTGDSPSSLLYVPDGNFSGSDSFVLKVYDSGDINASDSIIITVNVLPLEDDPVFRTVSSGVAVKDNLFDYSIKVVDEDLNSTVTISSLVPLPSWVTLRDDGNGSARLWGTPDQYDLASNLIVLEGRDETNRFAIQAFMLVVLEQNTNPIITQGEVLSISHIEDTTWQGRSFVSASDVDGQFLTWSLKVAPSNGTAQVSGQGSSPTVLEYLPDSNYSGLDSFQVEVSDGIGTDLITINLNIQNVEDTPVFLIPPTDQVTIDNQSFFISPKVYDSDTLVGSTIQLTGPAWLEVSSFDLTTTDQKTGIIQLKGVPRESDEGNSSFTLHITDSTGLQNSADFKVRVRVLNYAPSINSGLASVSVTMIEDDNTSWIAPSLVGADFETAANSLVWSVFSGAAHGSVDISGTGPSPSTFSYVPDGNFSGSDSFIAQVADGGGIESSASKYATILVNVEVTPVNDPPVFTSIPYSDRNGTYSCNDESVYVYNIKTFDADWNYSWHSIDLNISGNLPEWLTFKDEGNGTGILYGLPSVKDEGNHTISLEVFDSNKTSSVQAFELEVRIDNYPPVFKSVSEANKTITELIVYVDEDSNTSSLRGRWVAPSDYLALDPDPGNPKAKTLTWSLSEIPLSGSNVLVGGSGERPDVFSYTPALNYFGEDIVQLKVYDGHRYSILPVRIQVRELPDTPVFSNSFNSILVAKEGAQFNFEIKTYDPDYSPRSIKVFGLPSGGNSWLQLVDLNSSSGTARLFGVPPSQTSGDRYELAFVVTDDTGRFSVSNAQLIVDGKNSSPVINLGATAVVRFDRSGNAKSSDLSRLYATDLEGGFLQWSLSPNLLPSFGEAKVSGNGVQSPTITYLPYSTAKEDKFKIRVSDGVSFDEIEITALVVESFESFEVSDPTISSIPAGRLFVEHFKVSNTVFNSKIDAFLSESPSWMKIEKVEFDLFKLHGIVPSNLVGDVAIKISFLEDGKSKATKEYKLKVTDSTPPKLSLKGNEFIRLRIGSNFVEPGYFSVDQDGKDLSSSVEVSGTVNSNQQGLNQISYRSTDSAGNFSVLKRVIQVVEGNNSVQTTPLNTQPNINFEDFAILDKGVVLLEFVSDSESRLARYSEYTDFSNPIYSIKFNAENVRLNKVLILEDNHILVCGVFRGNLSFGENLVRSKGNHNLFVLKLDSNFKRIWFKTLSCSSTLENFELMQTPDHSIQIGGNFREQLQTDSQTWNAQGESDNFIWNIKKDGGFGWLKTFGGTGTEEMVGLNSLPDGSFLSVSNTQKKLDPMYCTVIKFSKDGEVLAGKSLITGFHNKAIGFRFEKESIFLSGEFKTKLVIDNKTVLSTSSQSGFISSLTLDLVPNWLVAFSSSGKTKAEKIQIDPFGYPLCILSFDGNLSLPGSSHTYLSKGQNDLMAIKLNPLNGSILWEESIGSTGQDTLYGFHVDSFGTVLVGAGLSVPFSFNGNLISEGSKFLLKLESVQGNPSFESVLDLTLLENEFFNQEIKVLNQSVVRLKMVSGPSWIDFHDNKDGTGMLGGLVPSFAGQSGGIRIRAYNTDGGVSDLDFNYSISANSQSMGSDAILPDFSMVMNFGKNVSVSSSSSLIDGSYLFGGTFLNSIKLGQKTFSSQGSNDGFVSNIGLNGEISKSIHLTSSGSLSIKSIITGAESEIYIMGDFSGTLQVGPFSINSVGGSDLFVLEWSTNGSLRNLTRIGGSGQEYFKKSVLVNNKFLISGEFEGTFSHGSYSVQSTGGKDGFILKVPQVDVSTVEWFQAFGGSDDDFVSDLRVSPNGEIFLAGSFRGKSAFGSISQSAVGLNDCFIAKLDISGNWKNIYFGGGAGEDEITSLTIQSLNRIIVCGNFMSDFKWGNRKIKSYGKQDGFIAVLSDSGNCVSLSAYGGIGNDSIDSLVNNGGQIFFAGSFDNQIDLAKKSFSTSGGRDSYIALLSAGGNNVLDAIHLGSGGEDIINLIDSSMVGHFLVNGISGGEVSAEGIFSASAIGTQNSYVSLFGPKHFNPTFYPTPKTSVLSSNVYEYEFITGPWPKDAELSLHITEKPVWLNIELFKDGKGLVWGYSPVTVGTVSNVKFDINATGLRGLTCEWKIEVMDSTSAFFILGDPLLSSPQFSKYRSEFTLSGAMMDDILILPQNLPPWLNLMRDSTNQFSIEGTPMDGDLGSHHIKILVHKILDHNSSHREELNYTLTIEPKILQDAASTSLGDWKTNWLGYFHSFSNLWTYHEDFQWVYLASGTQTDAVWFWTEKWGWLWTDSANWDASVGTGYLYSSLSEQWMYFQREQNNLPSIVYLYSENKWIEFE